MRIALLGTRGIPANYGGFETFAEELSARLADRGHEVTVYCRSHYASPGASLCRGAQLVVLPTIRTKHLDTAVHTLLSCLHLLVRGADVAIFCNAANAVFTCWPRVIGIPTVLNVDGLERKRRKWGVAARCWYRLSERLSTICPTAVVSDARVIQSYYRRAHALESHYIAYGATLDREPTAHKLVELGLDPGGYFLYVSRFEPENNPLLVAREFAKSRSGRQLVMVGDAPYAARYIEQVRSVMDPRILHVGSAYGLAYRELQSHCAGYIHATEVGGTHPALVEAMGRACPVLYLDTPENREVAGRTGLAYTSEPGSLQARIDELSDMDPAARQALGEAAAQTVADRYSWDRVADGYEQLLTHVLAGST